VHDVHPQPPQLEVEQGSGQALCTNPAALGGGSGDLTSYFDRVHAVFGSPRPNLARDPTTPDPPDLGTPFVALPGLVTAECVATDQFSYLSISPNAAPGPRVDDVAGDLTPPQWGLHTIDVSMALGDLVALVRAQAAAWAAS
jgi:hypothetical protein